MVVSLQAGDSFRRNPVVLSCSPEGHVRTSKRWLDFLGETDTPGLASEFVERLGTIDERLRPRRTPGGTFTVPKGSNAATLSTVAPRLDELRTLVSDTVTRVETEEAIRSCPPVPWSPSESTPVLATLWQRASLAARG